MKKLEETVLHNRYERAHGKKASSREVASWVFTTKEMGDVNYNDPKQVYFAKGLQKLGAAGKEAMKALGTKYVYVMEDTKQGIQEATSNPHVFVGTRNWDPTSNLRPNNKMKGDLILVKPVSSDFFENNLKDNIKDPYEFLEELGIHVGFGMLIRDKGDQKKLVDAIVKKKSFMVEGYYNDNVFAVDKNENKLKQTLKNYKVSEDVQELSKKTLGSYISKASDSRRQKQRSLKKQDKSIGGIKRASSKLNEGGKARTVDKDLREQRLTFKEFIVEAPADEIKVGGYQMDAIKNPDKAGSMKA